MVFYFFIGIVIATCFICGYALFFFLHRAHVHDAKDISYWGGLLLGFLLWFLATLLPGKKVSEKLIQEASESNKAVHQTILAVIQNILSNLSETQSNPPYEASQINCDELLQQIKNLDFLAHDPYSHSLVVSCRATKAVLDAIKYRANRVDDASWTEAINALRYVETQLKEHKVVSDKELRRMLKRH